MPIILVILSCCLQVVWAEEAKDMSSLGSVEKDILTIYMRALETNPDILSAKLQQELSEAQKRQALSNLLPQAQIVANFSKNHRYTENRGSNSYDGETEQVSVEQKLFDWSSWKNYKRYNYLTQQQASIYQDTRNRVILSVVEKYFNVLLANDQVRLIQAKKEAITKQLNRIKALYKRKLSKITDVYAIEARYDFILGEEIEVLSNQTLALEGLYELIGEQVEKVAPLRDDAEFTLPEKALDTWIEEAYKNSLELQSINYALLAKTKELEAIQAKHYPTLSLGGLYSHSDIGFDNSQAPASETSNISLNLSMPLYQGGLVSAQQLEAVKNIELEKQKKAKLKREIVKKVRTAYLGVQTEYLKIKASKRRIRSESKNYEAMVTGFRYGTNTVSDILDAQQNLFEAKVEYQRARYKTILNIFTLKQVMGIIQTEDMIMLNKLLLTAQ